MRVLTVVGAAVLLAGCAGRAAQPAELVRPAPAPASQTFDCVGRELGEMGYTVVSSDRQTGLIRATHVEPSPFWLRILGVGPATDVLLVSITPGQLRVTAASNDVDAPGGATAAAERDARALLSACGTPA